MHSLSHNWGGISGSVILVQRAIKSMHTDATEHNHTCDVGMTVVDQISQVECKTNTAKAFDPKADKWFECCDWAHSHTPTYSNWHTVNHEKVFEFFHHCFRNHCAKGGRRVRNHSFDLCGLWMSVHVQCAKKKQSHSKPAPPKTLGFLILPNRYNFQPWTLISVQWKMCGYVRWVACNWTHMQRLAEGLGS